jgi:hypothetical protein
MINLFAWTIKTLHFLIFSLPIFIIFLTDNIFILISMNVFFIVTLMLNYFYNDCPVSIIEDHYLDNSFVDSANQILPIKYDKNKRNLVTLQWIFMGILITTVKTFIVFLKSSIKDVCK